MFPSFKKYYTSTKYSFSTAPSLRSSGEIDLTLQHLGASGGRTTCYAVNEEDLEWTENKEAGNNPLENILWLQYSGTAFWPRASFLDYSMPFVSSLIFHWHVLAAGKSFHHVPSGFIPQFEPSHPDNKQTALSLFVCLCITFFGRLTFCSTSSQRPLQPHLIFSKTASYPVCLQAPFWLWFHHVQGMGLEEIR